MSNSISGYIETDGGSVSFPEEQPFEVPSLFPDSNVEQFQFPDSFILQDVEQPEIEQPITMVEDIDLIDIDAMLLPDIPSDGWYLV